ncbi:zinc metalloprotease HtpX [Halomonas koreensis]|uniref:Zinc metalloprotease HtpX n=1 Tax=Halomonas koreensis TaxID=245385 RepID=A0ABU1G489_9GAMM|nr:zinc metalloprotease HtpX [Halomonas koreensis]MDR5867772.1 zinc metalloprotease HtpX [Halomonas koreensis]
MPLRRDRLARRRRRNAAQTLLILAGLVISLSVPGYLLAGPGGVMLCLAAVTLATLVSGWLPARVILAQAGAGILAPAQAPALYRVVARLYERAGLERAPRLYYSPTPELNAFAVGHREDGGIAVTEGLLRTLTLRELAGVLAHEVSHLRHGDTRVMSIAAAMTRLTLWLATAIQLAILISLPLVIAGELRFPWLALLLVALAPTASTLLSLALSRQREHAADLEAVDLTGDPRGLASALAALERHQGRWLSSLFGRHRPVALPWLRTHPDTRERIRRLAELDDVAEAPDPLAAETLEARPTMPRRPPPLRRRDWLRRR